MSKIETVNYVCEQLDKEEIDLKALTESFGGTKVYAQRLEEALRLELINA